MKIRLTYFNINGKPLQSVLADTFEFEAKTCKEEDVYRRVKELYLVNKLPGIKPCYKQLVAFTLVQFGRGNYSKLKIVY